MSADGLTVVSSPSDDDPQPPERVPAVDSQRRAWAVTGPGTEAAVLWVGTGLALALWWFSLSRFDLAAAGSTGLIGVLPATYVAALAALAALLGWQLSRPQPSSPRLTAAVAALVVVMFSVPNLVDGTGMTPAGYVHVGFIDYINVHHAVLAHYDARFDWPGFFAAGAVLVRMAGLPDAMPLLQWSPVVFQLLAMAPVLLIARCVIGRERGRWLAVVLFYAGSWFAQDYFSPQAVTYILYLSVLAVLLWTVSAGRAGGLTGVDPADRPGRRPALPEGLSDGWAVAVQLLLTVVLAAMVVTHQLTPICLIFQLVLLSVLGATRYRALWLAGLLIFVVWFSYGAEDFWLGHLVEIEDDLGQLGSSVNRGLTSRISGDPTYLQMQLLRTYWSGLFLLLGVIGGVVLLSRRQIRSAATMLGLALAPFALIGLQSYGGEIFLRCFLYAMPLLAVLAAVAVSAAFRLPTVARIVSLSILVLVGSLGLVTTRGVNVAFERVSPDALAAAKFVSASPAQNTDVAVVETFAPLTFTAIDVQKVGPLGKGCETQLVICAAATRPDEIMLSLEQENYGRLHMDLPAGWLMQAGAAQLVGTGDYQVVFSRPGALVLQRRP